MKCLVYCIIPERDGLRSALPPGADGVPLAMVVADGLACVFERLSELDSAPAVSRLLAYARNIEELAVLFPLLPMRYGSAFDSEAELRDFLRKRHKAFHVQLEKLDWCSEMTIRVLPKRDEERGQPSQSSQPRLRSGTAYLESRRATYEFGEDMQLKTSQLCDEIRTCFHGLFRMTLTEDLALKGHSLISLHFLVPKEHVTPFRDAFQQFHRSFSRRVLLSGPWPPYNFASAT